MALIVTTMLTRWEMFSLTSDTSQARGERIASSLNTWGSSIVAFFFRSDCLQIVLQMVCRDLQIVILLLQFRLAKYIRLVKNEHLLSLQLAGQGLGKDKISTISFMTVSVFSSPKLLANINNYDVCKDLKIVHGKSVHVGASRKTQLAVRTSLWTEDNRRWIMDEDSGRWMMDAG